MKSIKVSEKLWERLQKLKLKFRKKSISQVIEDALDESVQKDGKTE